MKRWIAIVLAAASWMVLLAGCGKEKLPEVILLPEDAETMTDEEAEAAGAYTPLVVTDSLLGLDIGQDTTREELVAAYGGEWEQLDETYRFRRREECTPGGKLVESVHTYTTDHFGTVLEEGNPADRIKVQYHADGMVNMVVLGVSDTGRFRVNGLGLGINQAAVLAELGDPYETRTVSGDEELTTMFYQFGPNYLSVQILDDKLVYMAVQYGTNSNYTGGKLPLPHKEAEEDRSTWEDSETQQRGGIIWGPLLLLP